MWSRCSRERTDSLTSTLDGRASAFAEAVENSTRDANAAFEQTSQAVANAIGERLGQIEQVLDERTVSLTQMIETRGEAFARAVADSSREANSAFEQTSNAVAAAIGEKLGQIEQCSTSAPTA